MEYRSAKGFTGWGQTGILVAFLGLGLVIAGIIQFVIGLHLIDPNIPAAQKADAMLRVLFKPENTAWMQISQVASTFFLLFLPSLLYSLVCNGKYPLWLGFSPRINGWQVILAFFIIFCANIGSQPLEEFSKQIMAHFPALDKRAKESAELYSQTVMAVSNIKTWGSLVLAVVVMGFFPAIFEEVFFRGAVQNLFIRWWNKPLLGIFITSIIFSFVHGEYYPFLSRLVLGFALGLMYWQSKNLWVNIIAHFLNNSVAMLQLFMVARSNEKPDNSKLEEHFPWWAELACIVLLYGLFVLFRKVSAANRAKIEMDKQKVWIKSTPKYNLADYNNPFN